MTGNRVLLKAELFQKTGSFKPRGILYRLLRASQDERAAGFVSISAGNAAAALAWAATRIGARSAIVMPRDAVRSKIEATEGYGGEVVPTDGDYMGDCRRVQAERGMTFVHPFDDLDVLAGHGVSGLEILEDEDDLDAILVPVGGGGLIGGIAAAVKNTRPSVQVIGVEPAGANVMTRSLASGRVETVKPDTIADGLAAPFAGEHTLRHAQAWVDRVVTVTDEQILDALRLLWTRSKLAAEPSGAAALAAVVSGVAGISGRTVACVVSGGNVDASLVSRVLA
ncbi:MAG: pyridoxal-phosphate dependent enzyme [Acidobacteria bacterium]|nr:pyridoxal-phosphate dependent enzyme [Acidobacteriota bacterium]NIM62545.1 pyridoxal-phosphate dependent enzyme [Acidobacteriota bacterium]NIO58278.1 pyridoxal-phosphate dependent enzyme [Acidobacteriota bacterium]NIQ29334.1 pyridoxal-phosphate dependent enzyme [Acidobacteriota bacterium]NIQ83934.1 pyridoxal-phosphate dependent enzyme [Acidobacteriota bacterium]